MEHGTVPQRAHQTAPSRPKFGATLGAAAQRALGGNCGDAQLTVREVAERLRISTATVYVLCHRGELRHHRISNAIRVPESALAKYLGGANMHPKGKP